MMNDNFSHEAVEHYLSNLYSADPAEDGLCEKCDNLFRNLLHQVTDTYKMPFNTVFSQVAFISSQLRAEGKVTQALHHYRLYFLQNNQPGSGDPVHEHRIRVGILSILCDLVYDTATERFAEEQMFVFRHTKKQRQHTEFIPYLRFSIVKNQLENGILSGLSELEPDEEKTVLIDPVNQENLLKALKEDLAWFDLPVTVALNNVRVMKGNYHPESVILLPDFLLDVTAVAECYSYDGANANLHFLKKLTPKASSDSLFIGLSANAFLDELVFNPDLEFRELAPLLFKISPLYLASKSDEEVKSLMEKASMHYFNIRDFVISSVASHDLDLRRSLIEPSYCSPVFGLQGRLDLFIDNEQDRAIIELKSGKLFRENNYGINYSHYIQTLLYDLLVRRNERSDKDMRAFILYSQLSEGRLRFAPPVRSLQMEALLVRNRIMTIEHRLTLIDANGYDPSGVFSIGEELLREGLTGFTASDLNRVMNGLSGLSPVEYKYFKACTGFVAREYFGSKAGFLRDNNTNGQAGLWLNNVRDKTGNHALMGFLQPEKVDISGQDTIITLQKSPRTDLLADFRAGDIVVLYATDEDGRFLWEGRQMFKGTLIANNEQEAVMRLRARQNRKDLFYADTYWNMEKDVIDSGFGGQFKSLVCWALSDGSRRQLLMGATTPRKPATHIEIAGMEIRDYHRQLLEKALSAQDYFLLWGPPGTGKTSFMVKNMIHLLSVNIEKPLLVLAYTNRAVDELCGAIESIGPEYRDKYIRIGSRFSTDPAYVDNLFDVCLQDIHNRRQLLEMLGSKRIIIGTASSLLGKTELFDLLSFEWALIDEASQILDPQVLEILGHVRKFIMIGDHKQLPAVVTQHKGWCEVTDPELNGCGIYDLSQSLFERLYLRAVSQGWDWAYGLLHEQGRMHRDIMAFPAHHFYQQKLTTLLEHQTAPDYLSPVEDPGHSGHKPLLSKHRVLFLHTSQPGTGFLKMNDAEASLIHTILLDLHDLYLRAGRRLEDASIGIITPFRAQIVNITNMIEHLPFRLNITVDTVERFQGAAKDIILLSMVVSSASQAASIVSTNQEGIDRKMNVALTRARERLIMVGNKEVLEQLAYYGEFVREYGV